MPSRTSVVKPSKSRKVFQEPQDILDDICDQIGSNEKRGKKDKDDDDDCPCPNASKSQRKNRRGTDINGMQLKRESEMSDHVVTFHVEHPNRVAVRLEFLLNSAIVKLNDKDYMSKLHDKLVEDENLKTRNNLRRRELKEQERVKDLVIKGKMKPPPDLQHLYKHPVFIVNDMLRRLEEHSHNFYAPDKLDVPVYNMEPFEFDPNGRFFSHLHRTGSYWVPSDEKLAQQEKMEGKIERAKQRLQEKRRREAEEIKTVRYLFKNEEERRKENDFESMTDEGSLSGSVVTITSDNSENDKEPHERRKKQNELANKMREDNRMTLKDRRRKQTLIQRENERRERQKQRIMERERTFYDEKEKERDRIIEKHQQRIHRFDHLRRKPDIITHSTVDAIFRMQDTPPLLQEEESFKLLRKNYNLRGSNKFDMYRPPDNPLISKYLDGSKDTDNLYMYGEAVKGVYDRKQMRADDFMSKLNRMF